MGYFDDIPDKSGGGVVTAQPPDYFHDIPGAGKGPSPGSDYFADIPTPPPPSPTPATDAAASEIPGGPQVLSPAEEKAAVMNAPQWAQELARPAVSAGKVLAGQIPTSVAAIKAMVPMVTGTGGAGLGGFVGEAAKMGVGLAANMQTAQTTKPFTQEWWDAVMPVAMAGLQEAGIGLHAVLPEKVAKPPVQTEAPPVQVKPPPVPGSPEYDVRYQQPTEGGTVAKEEKAAPEAAAPQAVRPAGEVLAPPEPAPAPPAAAPTVTLYHGGAGDVAGSDFSPDLNYAQGYADKSGGKVWSVQVPADSPFLKRTAEGDLITRQTVPDEVANQAEPAPEAAPPAAAPAAPAGEAEAAERPLFSELGKEEPPVPEGMTRVYRGGVKGREGQWFSTDRDTAEFHQQNAGYDGPTRLSYVDIPSEDLYKYEDAAFEHPDVLSGKTIAEANDLVLPKDISSVAKTLHELPQEEPLVPSAPPRVAEPPQVGASALTLTEKPVTMEKQWPGHLTWTHEIDVTNPAGKRLATVVGDATPEGFQVKGATVVKSEQGKGHYQNIIRQLADKYGTVVSDIDQAAAAEAAWKKVGAEKQADGRYVLKGKEAPPTPAPEFSRVAGAEPEGPIAALPPPETPGTQPPPVSGINNDRLAQIYGPDAVVAGKGRSAQAWKQIGQADPRDPYAVLENARQQGIAPPADVALLRTEHQRLLNDARNAYGTPFYNELAQRAVDMANAIKGVAHGPASDVFRVLQEQDIPRYESPADFDNIVRERMNREATPTEKATFQKMTDEIKNGNGEAVKTASDAQQKLRQSRPRAAKEPMKFADAADYIRKQIKELTIDCAL